jgi:hypothetical protein
MISIDSSDENVINFERSTLIWLKGKENAMRAHIFVCIWTLTAFAQVLPVGTADGTVTDPSGAVLTEAKVTLTHLGTGQIHAILTNGAGYFYAPLLPPGLYSVAAKSQASSEPCVISRSSPAGARQPTSASRSVKSPIPCR